MKEYRSTILYKLGWENGKPVPTPKGFEGGTERSTYTKTGTNREQSPLKDFKKDLKNG